MRPSRRAGAGRSPARVALLLALVVLAGCDTGAGPDVDRPAVQPASVLDDRLRTLQGETLSVDRIVPVAGFAYSARIAGRIPGLREGGDGRTLRLVEDGAGLGPPGALSADVVKLGAGRFNHEFATRILFSTSDNSDPRVNGRTYRVEWDEPARVFPRSTKRSIGLGKNDVVVDVTSSAPVSARRLILENTDPRRAVRVWARAANAPDLTTRDALLASVLRPEMSDEEKALALWAAMATWRDHDVAAAAGLEASDPVKLIGVYGFGFCNDVAHALASLLQRAGVRARVVAWDQHSVVEARIDGRWRLLDADLGRIYRTRSGQLASVADVFARRATTVWSPAGEVALADERFDVVYPRRANRRYKRPHGSTAHALRPVLEPGDVVVFDFGRGENPVDRFSHERPPGWPIRFANGTLRRRPSEPGPDGCRVARVDWPYPIVAAQVVARGVARDSALVVAVRGGDPDDWQQVRAERVAADVRADAAVWLARSPIRYGLEMRICGAQPAERSGADIRLEVAFQFAPRSIPRVTDQHNVALWSVEDVAPGSHATGRFAGVRLTQEWDELDVAGGPAAAPPG